MKLKKIIYIAVISVTTLTTVSACKDNKKKFYAVESWESNEALDGHKATSHYAVYKASYEPYCDDKYTEDLDILG